MAEFSFLAYYKEPKGDRQGQTKDASSFSYTKYQSRQQRFQSLTPVMENETPEEKSKHSRRFSLDALFSKKKKEFKLPKDARRGTTASSSSIDSTYSNDPSSSKPTSRRGSVNSAKVSQAEIAAWIFS